VFVRLSALVIVLVMMFRFTAKLRDGVH